MKRRLPLVAGLLLATCVFSVSADDWEMVMTVDNQYDVYFGSDTEALTHVGFSACWPCVETWNASAMSPNDHLYIVTSSDHFVAQGFIGAFYNTTLGTTIMTGMPIWEVFPAGAYLRQIDPTWPSSWPSMIQPTQAEVNQAIAYANANNLWETPVTEPGYTNGDNPRPWRRREGIPDSAAWIWHDSGKNIGRSVLYSGFNHDEFLIFRIRGGAEPPAPCFDWSTLDYGTNLPTLALTRFDVDDGGPQPAYTIAAGSFTRAGDEADANYVAAYLDYQRNWYTLGTGMNREVTALAVYDDGSGNALYAGGWFTRAGAAAVSFLAKWDGMAWSDVGGGVTGGPNAHVSSLAVYDDGSGPALYVGGTFTAAGGVPVSGLARWDGSTWSDVGGGVSHSNPSSAAVNALVVHDGDGAGPNPASLFAGGSFTQAGGRSASNIARWDGTDWYTLGAGVNNAVYALTPYDDDDGGPNAELLIAGGAFTTAGGLGANRIASWDGVQWVALGQGVNDTVRALATFDEDGADPGYTRLFVGGFFTTAGGATAEHIASWDGATWHQIWNMGGPVHALLGVDAGAQSGLYVGGDYLRPGRNILIYGKSESPWISQISDQLKAVDQDTTIRARAVGRGALTYQWFKGGVPLSDGATGHGSTIAGATTDTLQIYGLQTADSGQYEVEVSDSCATHSQLCNVSVVEFIDCNNNGVHDLCDLYGQLCEPGDPSYTSDDCNGNGVPDECDIADDPDIDCNNNSVPDSCDMTAGGCCITVGGQITSIESPGDCVAPWTYSVGDTWEMEYCIDLEQEYADPWCYGSYCEYSYHAFLSYRLSVNGSVVAEDTDPWAYITTYNDDPTLQDQYDIYIETYVPSGADATWYMTLHDPSGTAFSSAQSGDCTLLSLDAFSDRSMRIEPWGSGSCILHGSVDSLSYQLAATDCNGNLIPDECETDCNGNGIPDDCDLNPNDPDGDGIVWADCQPNNVPDVCDIAGATSVDANGDDIPDECQLDCNNNGIHDRAEIDDGSAADCNHNLVPDECDISGGTSSDCDGNGVPDECDPDCNANGVADSCDIDPGDPDGDGEVWEDCNGNLLPDACESWDAADDCNLNAYPDECEILAAPGLDCNGNGILDECEIIDGSALDCNNNFIPDSCDIDVLDPDNNGEVSADGDGDGIPDECQADCNANTVADTVDILEGTSADCNGNGVPDECELDAGAEDCNTNGILDECDIASGNSEDTDGDGMPDECLALLMQACCFPDNSCVVILVDDCTAQGGTPQGTGTTCDDGNGNGLADICEDCNGNGIVDAEEVVVPPLAIGQDNCEDAELVCPGIYTGTTVGANNDGDSTCGSSSDSPDMWYRYRPVSSGSADILLCGSDYDTVLSIHSGCPGTIDNEIFCNDDRQDTCPSLQSAILGYAVDAGTDYWIRIAGFSGATGNYELEIIGPPCVSPDCNSNGIPDECDVDGGASEDCNGNGVPDECDLADGTSADCNLNNVPDECDLSEGTSQDCNGNGALDECESADPEFAEATDACADAEMACPGYYYTGNTSSADSDGSASCGSSANSPDMWYRYTPASSGTLTISLCDSSYDTVLSVHSGCPGTSANELACNDDSGACYDLQSQIGMSVEVGQTYWIRISGYYGDYGDFAMELFGPACAYSLDCDANDIPDECEPAGSDCNTNGVRDACDIVRGVSEDCQPNGIPDECEFVPHPPLADFQDNCEDAAYICPGVTYYGDTYSANNDGMANCGASEFSPDVWYRYRPVVSGVATISLCGSEYDTVLSVHSDCPGGYGNEIVCNDDSCGLQSEVSLSVDAGYEYLIRVSGYDYDIGDFQLVLTGPACSNDCNENGVLDECDISGGVSEDCDGNGEPDECQADSDNDGVIDPCDGCPSDPNKTEPGQCGCGVPDIDSDGDGVADCNDICPGYDDNADADEDGTPDGCDGCPDDPNKTEPGQCGCGNPDTDSDGDGVADCNDVCPGHDDNADADGDGVPDGCDVCEGHDDNLDGDGDGVPDGCDICPGYDDHADADEDGTPDGCDGCPDDPNKTEPGQCGCGNPDTDSDGDGVADCNDVCPGHDDNADADGDGVPDGCDICPGYDDNVDSDGDSTPDGCDGCPLDPEKTEPGVCGCGVPDTDSDGDGTPDCNDGCPDDPEKTEPGACGCGIPDTDSDGDGTPDCNDGCPDDPDKTEPGACGCGVPDTDSDGDGTPDCNDGCPDDPDKTEPGECGCGTPDTDSDGDGTPDCNDGCPDDPDKTEPGACGCGVPDTDSDGDGVPDCNDICPGFDDNADADNDGTPDGCDGCPNDPNKTDPGVCGCGTPDTDSDGDGVADCNDICPGHDDNADGDGDSVPDGCDNCPAVANADQADCDGDGVGDACAGEPDCNTNTVPDSCDIAQGTSVDVNGNGIPDECESASGACCIDDGGTITCVMAIDEVDCTVTYGGVWAGGGTTCLDDDGDGVAEACEPPPTNEIVLEPGASCFTDELVVKVVMRNQTEQIVGGQFTLGYDTSRLTFVSADPGDGLWTELYEVVNAGAGEIDYAVNAPYGDPGTTGDSTMALITFAIDPATPDDCATEGLVWFRPHDPPTRLSNYDGEAVYAALLDLTAVPVDRTAPVISDVNIVGGNVDANCETVVTFSGIVTDNCCVPEDSVFVDLVVTTGNADLSTPTVALTPNATNGFDISGSVVVSNLTDCPATVQWTVYALDCCGNAAGTQTSPLLGRFSESFAGGGPGQPGNVVHAGSWDGSSLYGQWEISGPSLVEAQLVADTIDVWGKGERVYFTTYTGGTVTVNAALWGGSGMVTADILSYTHETHNLYLSGAPAGSYTDVVLHARLTGELGLTATARAETLGQGSALPPDYPALLGGAVTGGWGDLVELSLATVSLATGDVNDVEPPVIWWDEDGGSPPDPVVGCPPDIVVNADAGQSAAVVTWIEPYATDNCTVASLVSSHSPGDTFPLGTTTVTYTAADPCGNTTDCSFYITVEENNSLQVIVELQGVHETAVDRCITFTLWNCTTLASAEVEAVLTFESDGVANAIGTASLDVPLGTWDCITARDRLHTLRRTDEGFEISGASYVADFTGDPETGGDWLIGGNFNDDMWIDILDFGVFTSQWSTNLGTGDCTCSTPDPHADASGDGIVGSADFTFVQTNFWEANEQNCCGQAGLGGIGEPVSAISLEELEERGLSDLAVADLNGDGWLDAEDMAAFMNGVRPSVRKTSAHGSGATR